ncbi:Uncharacterised protein [Vibrio cholerae]|nr:Uncharacterised protein [Vibrio cholerae]
MAAAQLISVVMDCCKFRIDLCCGFWRILVC